MFGLDAQSIAERVRASGRPARVPSLGESILVGMIGFTMVSLGGFAPWVLAGRWFYKNVGEVGLYVACAVVFVGLSGLCLHRLIIGPGSVARCYKIFSLAFLAYAVVWTAAYIPLRGVTGGVVGALAGLAIMGIIIAAGFKSMRSAPVSILVLVVGNLAGYFIGDLAHNVLTGMVSKAAWGLCYGLGFGAGIGFAFYAGQTEARRLIAGS